MTSLFKRIKDNVLAEAHQMLDDKERKSPVAMLNQYLRNCETEVRKVEKLIERQNMLKRQFYHEKEKAKSMLKRRLEQADIASRAQEVELEARARHEVEYYTEQAEKLEVLHAKAEQDIFQLQNQLHDMKNKLKEMNTKRLELMSRENVAHANRRINESMNKFTESNPFFRFDEVEQQIQDLELRINADYDRDTFDMRIAKLERDMVDEIKSD